jgi:predicted Zn finger-like uncharacterized protein
MIIACPSCSTRFSVKATAFPAEGRKVRCARCSHVWHATMQEGEPTRAADRVEPAPLPPQKPPEPVVERRVEHFDPAPPIDDPAPELIWADAGLPERNRAHARNNLWAGIAAAVAVTGLGMIYFRESIVQTVPPLGPVFAAIGLPVDITGLELQIEAEAMSESASTGVTTLVVKGTIANVTSEERPVPYIEATLLGKDKSELHSWVFDPGITTLKPGETHDFKQVLAQPPAETYQVYAHFAGAGG